MRYQLATDPVYAPNSKGGPQADTERYGQPAGWHTDGDMVCSAYTLRLVDNVVGHLLNGVSEPVLERTSATASRRVSGNERDHLGRALKPPRRGS
jgi:catalase